MRQLRKPLQRASHRPEPFYSHYSSVQIMYSVFGILHDIYTFNLCITLLCITLVPHNIWHIVNLLMILSLGYCVEFCKFTHFCVGFLWILQFPPSLQKHAIMCIGYLKLPIDVKECVIVCAHGAQQWTGIPSRVFSCLVLTVPGIGSRSIMILTRIKHLQEMNG